MKQKRDHIVVRCAIGVSHDCIWIVEPWSQLYDVRQRVSDPIPAVMVTAFAFVSYEEVNAMKIKIDDQQQQPQKESQQQYTSSSSSPSIQRRLLQKKA